MMSTVVSSSRIKFDQEQYVTAAEIVPGNPKIVHHVLLFWIQKERQTKLDEGESGSGYTCFGGPGFIPIGGLAVGLLEILLVSLLKG